MTPKQPSEGAIVDEVRARALQLTGRFDNDLRKYAKYLQAIESRHPDRLVGQLAIVPLAANGVSKRRRSIKRRKSTV